MPLSIRILFFCMPGEVALVKSSQHEHRLPEQSEKLTRRNLSKKTHAAELSRVVLCYAEPMDYGR